MSQVCHICKLPEEHPAGTLCSSGEHPRVQLIIPAKPKRNKDMIDAEYAIFFDIDGCFHRQGAAKFGRNGDLLPSSEPLFTWAEAFLKIIKPYHNVALICHSTLRLMTTEGGIFRMLPPLMQERFLTCTVEVDRYQSILKTGKDFGFKEYIIIDDSPGEFPKGLPNFVECNSYAGMSSEFAQEDLKQIMLKLFGPPPENTD